MSLHSGTMQSHCCLNSFVNYIDSVEISSHLPVKMKLFLCLLIQMDLHADLYTMSSPTRHLKTIRKTQTELFIISSEVTSAASVLLLSMMLCSSAKLTDSHIDARARKCTSARELTSALASVRALEKRTST